MRIALSMIVRDELRRGYQPALLQHALDSWASEARIYDDGSVDGTGEALFRAGVDDPDGAQTVSTPLGLIDRGQQSRVYVRSSPVSVWDRDGEGAARQKLLDFAVAIPRPTHVLALDADEFVADPLALLDAIRRNPDADVFTVRMVEVWDRSEPLVWRIRVDGGWAPREVPILWKVPREMGDGWQIRPDRLACGREPEIVALLGGMGDAVRTGVDVCHLGWSDPSTRQARYERYVEIDGGQYHASAHIQSIVEPPTLAPYPGFSAALAL